jgi:hypothetical protein
MSKIPCKECISLAICRHKHYETLLFSCDLIFSYLSIYGDERPYDVVDDKNGEVKMKVDKKLHEKHEKRVRELVKVLNPSRWKIGDLDPISGYSIELTENDHKVHWATTYC